MSSGFDGRLLGAMCCGRVRKYIGTDPSGLTMDGLREMREELSPMLRQLGHEPSDVGLHRIGSEDFVPESESIDLCFTSPPYGGHEQYNDEPAQSYIRFPTNESWLNGYMRMTLDNCWAALKRNGFLVVNIANVASYPNLTEDCLGLALRCGFQHVETLRLALSAMPGTRAGSPYKFEPMYVFRKAAYLTLTSSKVK